MEKKNKLNQKEKEKIIGTLVCKILNRIDEDINLKFREDKCYLKYTFACLSVITTYENLTAGQYNQILRTLSNLVRVVQYRYNPDTETLKVIDEVIDVTNKEYISINE